MKTVVDTNVLVSGLISPHGPPGRIVDLLREGVLQLVVDERILWEYQDVLTRPQVTRYFTREDMTTITDFFRHSSERIVPVHICGGLPDPGDIPFLEVAATAGVALVTGNARHFPVEERGAVCVQAPTEFLQEFRKRGGTG